MSYSLQSLTHSNDLKYMFASFAMATSMWTALYTVKYIPPACLFCVYSGLERLCQTLKTILSTELTFYLLSCNAVHFSGPICLLCFPLQSHSSNPIFLQNNIAYGCIGKTTEVWMLGLVSKSDCPLWSLFSDYWELKFQFQLEPSFFVAQCCQQQNERGNCIAFVCSLHFVEVNLPVILHMKGLVLPLLLFVLFVQMRKVSHAETL